MTKLETAATAATWILMNALAVLVAVNPLPSHSQAPVAAVAITAGPAATAQS